MARTNSFSLSFSFASVILMLPIIARATPSHYVSVTVSGVSPNSTIMLHYNDHIPYIAPLVLQNTTLDKSQYVIAKDVIAGNAIDNNRTNGDVVVKNGVEYEIEASGTVTLDRGFHVEKGATFAIYPSCF